MIMMLNDLPNVLHHKLYLNHICVTDIRGQYNYNEQQLVIISVVDVIIKDGQIEI